MNKILQSALCGGAVMLVAMAAQAAPTITNGGFETGDFSGWSLVETLGYNAVASDAPHAGDYSAFFGETGAPATITQSLATEAGHTYSVSFWLANLGGNADNLDTTNTFQMLVGSNALLSLTDKTATDYTQYQVQFTAATNATNLTFGFHHDENFWLFDDVAIREVQLSVPEPSAALMLALGLGLLGLKRRFR